MDWIDIQSSLPQDNEIVWIENNGKVIQAKHVVVGDKSEFYDEDAEELPYPSRWATLEVIY